jgi:hypothetical protein
VIATFAAIAFNVSPATAALPPPPETAPAITVAALADSAPPHSPSTAPLRPAVGATGSSAPSPPRRPLMASR